MRAVGQLAGGAASAGGQGIRNGRILHWMPCLGVLNIVWDGRGDHPTRPAGAGRPTRRPLPVNDANSTLRAWVQLHGPAAPPAVPPPPSSSFLT